MRSIAWVVEDTVCSGSLEDYADSMKSAMYGGLGHGTQVWTGSDTLPVRVTCTDHDSDDYLHYMVEVWDIEDNRHMTRFVIDGRV